MLCGCELHERCLGGWEWGPVVLRTEGSITSDASVVCAAGGCCDAFGQVECGRWSGRPSRWVSGGSGVGS